MPKFLFRLIISFIPAIFLYFLSIELFPNNELKTLWFLAYCYIIFALLITPIAKIFLKFKSIKKYLYIIKFRRAIWILAWFFSLLHLMDFEENIRTYWSGSYSQEKSYSTFLFDEIFSWWGVDVIWMNFYGFWLWMIWIIITIILLIISNDLSSKIIWAKIWKNIQKLVYPLFILLVLHIYFVWWLEWLYLYPAIFLILFRLYVFIDECKYKSKKQINTNWYRKFLCLPCWFIYDEELWDPDSWLAPWTKFEDIPENWKCPVCQVTKKDFIALDEHYNPKHTENHELDFELKAKKFLTKDVVELSFYSEKNLEILPWQFCNFVFEEKITRSYSVVKYIDNHIYFLIKLKPNWKWSEIIKKLKIWEKIKTLWPFWDFVVQNTSNKKIFIATWTWLAPIYNMIEKSWNIEKELYFWVQKKSDLFYLEELEKIPNLKINIFLSQEKVYAYNYWRINYKNLNLENNPEIYICWNPKLVEDLENNLKNIWIQKIYYEKFL